MSDQPVLTQLSELSFEEAETLFRKFLKGQGFGSDLYWVFAEDVIIAGLEIIFVRMPIPHWNRERAGECFDLGKQRDFGMAFHAFAILDGVPCAYISLPEDDIDAQYKMMSNQNVKLTCTTPMPKARSISNLIAWKICQLTSTRPGVVRWDEAVPTKKTLLPR